MPYDDVVIQRACSLYEAVFRPGEAGLVVSGQTRYVSHHGGGVRKRFRRHRPNLFQLSRRYSLGLHGPAGRLIQVVDVDDSREITTFRWTEITGRGIDYKFILKANANAEHYSRRPANNDRVYFHKQKSQHHPPHV
jgi:hypothetical protein